MYFCVKIPLRIAGKHYRPCISYKIGENMLSTAKKLAEEGKAEVSETPIFFQNGKKIVKKEEKTASASEKSISFAISGLNGRCRLLNNRQGVTIIKRMLQMRLHSSFFIPVVFA